MNKLTRLIIDYFLVFLSFFPLFSGCKAPEVPGGQITISNRILDKEYNTFTVDEIRLENGATSYQIRLKPEEDVIIPYKNVRSMRFTRQYKDYAMVYQIECPSGFNSKITIKLIDVHTNKIAGGCKLVKRGKRENGSWTKWE